MLLALLGMIVFFIALGNGNIPVLIISILMFLFGLTFSNAFWEDAKANGNRRRYWANKGK